MPMLVQKAKFDSAGIRKGVAQAKSEIKKYSKTSKKEVEGAHDKAGKSAQKMSGKMKKGFKEANKEQEKLGSMAKKVSRKMKLAWAAALTAIAFAARRFMGQAVRDARKFNLEMQRSVAIMDDVSDATRGQMETIARATATSLNLQPEKVAEGYFFLASAGFDAAQSIAALPEVARFAKAGAFDMAQATDLSTDALSALGLKSDDAAENLKNLVFVQDRLVKANQISNATVAQFSESLTNRAGNAIRELNIGLESGLAVLAAWADQGVKGTLAGRRLEIVTRDLQRAARDQADEFERMNIRIFDSEGEFKNLADIISDMENAFEGMSAKQRGAALAQLGFTDRSVAATRSLLGSSEAMRQYEQDLFAAGGATKEVADKQMKALDERIGRLTTRMGLWLQKGFVPILEGLANYADSVERANRSTGDLADDIVALNDDMEDLSKTQEALDFVREFEGRTGLADDQQKKLAESLEILQGLFPGLIKEYNDAGEAVSIYADNIQFAIDRQRDLAETTLAQDLREISKRFRDAQDDLDDMIENRERLLAMTTRFREEGPRGAIGGVGAAARTPEQVQADTEAAFARTVSRIRSLRADIRLTEEEITKLVNVFGVERISEEFEAIGFNAVEATRFIKELREEALKPLPAHRRAGVDETTGKSIEDQIKALQEKLDAAVEEQKPLLEQNEITERRAELNREILRYEEQIRILKEKQGAEEAKTLKQRFDALTEEKKLLVEQGGSEARILELNKKIFAIEQERDRLMNLGLDKLRKEQKRLENIAKIEKDLAEARDVQARLEEDEFTGLEPKGLRDIPSSELDPSDREVQDFTVEFLPGRFLKGEEAVAFIKRLQESTGKTSENSKAIAKSFRNIASAGRSLVRVADIFGEISDEMRTALDSSLSLMENMGALKDLSPNASSFDKLVPTAGIALSIAGILSSAIAGGDEEALKEAIEENTRRIEKSIDDLANVMRIGQDITGDQVNEIASQLLFVGGLLGNLENKGITFAGMPDVTRFESGVEDLLDLLSEAGFDTSGFEGRLESVVDELRLAIQFGDKIRLEKALENASILRDEMRGIIDPLLESLGLFNQQTAEGVIGRAQFLGELGGATQEEQLKSIVDGLLDLNGISDDMRIFLEQISEISDPTSPGGQAAIEAATEEIARLVAAGEFDFGALTPSEVDAILRAISGFESGGGGIDAGGATVSQQVQRTVTTFQMNEDLVLSEERNYILGLIQKDTEALLANLSGSIRRPQFDASSQTQMMQNTFNIGEISTTGNTEADIDQIMTDFEAELRRRLI